MKAFIIIKLIAELQYFQCEMNKIQSEQHFIKQG